MSREHSQALILFAKDPVEGQVKTRLSPLLDSRITLELYHHFLTDSLAKLRAVEHVDRFIAIASSPRTDYFEQVSREFPVRLRVQEGEDLGQRMRKAFEDRFQEGYDRVVIIGADSPTLPAAYIEQALVSSHDLVIGPCTDGGYYLIGMKGRTAEIFDGVPWGTDRVFSETLRRVQRGNIDVELLPVWYDVDFPEDLRFLKAHLEWMVYAGLAEGKATLEFLNQLNLE
ncbi:MAG: DUF2064 domain-containing protein [Nitrospinaceae bacterium]|nr:glycosyltransferase [Nitrospinaceae bacterium]NIR56969.1 glycosyltransferase [Nitrospinaceae bacterium]NIS87426.1 glycosyltransferase [Nitrospinaceae bacterium]NIT83868.1 glycosyltransferase [Nitrospinaceae bacterium]NIU46465.1 glycosyltransferase [Nitrospinaceae bacterium]